MESAHVLCSVQHSNCSVTHQPVCRTERGKKLQAGNCLRSYNFTLAESASLKGRAGWGGPSWQVAWQLQPGTAGTKSRAGCERTAGSQAHWELYLKVDWSNTKAFQYSAVSFFYFFYSSFLPQSKISTKFTSKLMLTDAWETPAHRIVLVIFILSSSVLMKW